MVVHVAAWYEGRGGGSMRVIHRNNLVVGHSARLIALAGSAAASAAHPETWPA
jgi:hypothetical protein